MAVGQTPQGVIATRNEVWNVGLLTWEPMQQPIINGGTVIVGTVDQGAGGSDPWLVDTPDSGTASAPVQTSVAAAGVILAANANRKRFMVQNTGTTILYLTFGPTNPTTTAYHVALNAGSVANDGTGGTYLDDQWTGIVRALSSGVGGICVVTELT